jgi:hypothetical protein
MVQGIEQIRTKSQARLISNSKGAPTDRFVREKPGKAFRPRLPWTGEKGTTRAAGLIRLPPAMLGSLIDSGTPPTRSGRKS